MSTDETATERRTRLATEAQTRKALAWAATDFERAVLAAAERGVVDDAEARAVRAAVRRFMRWSP